MLISVLAETSGYVSRNADGPELAHAIRMAVSGGSYYDRETVRRVVARLRNPVGAILTVAIPDVLTEREGLILRMVGQGLDNREIGEHLNVATNTARNYVIRIRDKLGLSSRERLVSYAARWGILMETDARGSTEIPD